MGHDTMIAAIYVRVSTSGQELENQLVQLRDYCKKSNWIVFHEYLDIVSGRENSRLNFDLLFKQAHMKLFDIVLFWSLDRFSRSGMTFTVLKLTELESIGIKWHSFTEPHVNTDNELQRNIVIAVMSSLAKIEAEKISLRTKLAFCKNKEGLTIARKSGKRVGRPTIPYKTIQDVKNLLESPNPPSYREISNLVVYKGKHGKKFHISTAKIVEIKNELLKNKNKRLEKG